LVPAMQSLGYVAAGLETVFELLFEIRRPPANAPLHEGSSGTFFRIAGVIEGPLALIVRIVWGSTYQGRYAAAICFLIGALLSRFAWIWAGRVSAKMPDAQFADQRSGAAKP
jgi:hypothetical protein